jgi:hypothetical protein
MKPTIEDNHSFERQEVQSPVCHTHRHWESSGIHEQGELKVCKCQRTRYQQSCLYMMARLAAFFLGFFPGVVSM